MIMCVSQTNPEPVLFLRFTRSIEVALSSAGASVESQNELLLQAVQIDPFIYQQ
jgi:hypothetical protein